MRVVTITGEYVNGLPLTAKPGPMLGTTRDNFMRNLFSLAATYGWNIQDGKLHHRPVTPSTPAVVSLANEKTSRARVKEVQRHYANVKPWVGV
jgi:hypothetical protein